ncbi:MAG: asparagine synthase (glutamine-hydrolyzing) [Planctomycetota bacterium]
MCGICGIFSPDPRARPDAALAERMNRTLAHRGPDGSGVLSRGPCVLGHRRLSIIDLAGGAQPMETPDGRYAVTYNGEVYNHRDLRLELEARGHRFRTRCDTEVVLRAYAEYGEACVDRLIGMFAFVVHDRESNELFLARDRLGQKPLYYMEQGGEFLFASEIPALALAPRFDASLDLASLHLYLAYLYVPSPRTIYAAVRSLPPAHAARVTARGMALRRYWRPEYSAKREVGYEEARAEVRRRVVEAAERRLMSDVPLGAFLSGGLDSTVTVAALSEASGGAISTFTIGSDDPRYDERAFAGEAARRFGTRHHVRVAEPRSLKHLEMLLQRCGQPFADSSILPTYMVSAFAREHVTVALSGDGADELFAGYDRYVALRLSGFLGRLPLSLRRAVAKAARALLPARANERTLAGRLRRFFQVAERSGLEQYLSAVARWRAEDSGAVYGPLLRDAAAGTPVASPLSALMESLTARDPVEKWMEIESLTYLPEDVLAKVDRASMAVSLEVRSPFLDHTLVEYVASLPFDWKLKGSERKHILKDAFRDVLPESIQRRGKMGFGVPVGEWLRGELRGLAREVLLAPGADCGGLFRPEGVRALLEAHLARQRDASYELWALLCFHLWRRGADSQPLTANSPRVL